MTTTSTNNGRTANLIANVEDEVSKKGLLHSDDPASLPGDRFRVFLPHRSGVDGDDFEELVSAEAGDDAAYVIRSIAEPHVFYVCGIGPDDASSRHSRIGDLVDRHVAGKAVT